MRVVVLLGGVSEEREVSLVSGCQVAAALRESGHDVVAIDPADGMLSQRDEEEILSTGVRLLPPGAIADAGALAAPFTMPEEIPAADVVFPALHGGMGEDGTLQALLDIGGITYAGSGVLGCALSMDKDVTKRILRDADIPTPDWLVNPTVDNAIQQLGLPLIAKPVAGGSSVGLCLLRDYEGVEKDIAEEESGSRERPGRTPIKTHFHVPSMMYEAFVAGREFTVGIVGGEPLPVGEIISTHELFDYECKYQSEMADEVFPADISDGLTRTLQERALKVHRLLRLRDFSRVDFMVDEGGKAWCLEANALPGMTANSLLPKAAWAAGTSFPEFCDRIVRMAADRISVGD